VVTSRDEVIGRRAAIATVVLVAVGLLGTITVVVTGLTIILIEQPVPVTDDPGATTVERYKGIFPTTMPWWLFLLYATGWVGVLAAVWKPERAYFQALLNGKVLIFASAGWTAIFAGLTAAAALSTGAYVAREGFGLFYIPALVLAVVAAVAGMRARVNHRRMLRALTRGRRAPKKKGRT
jgi:hypothetical protein